MECLESLSDTGLRPAKLIKPSLAICESSVRVVCSLISNLAWISDRCIGPWYSSRDKCPALRYAE